MFNPASDRQKDYTYKKTERSNFIGDSVNEMIDGLTVLQRDGNRKLNKAGVTFIKQMKCSKDKIPTLSRTLVKTSRRFNQIRELYNEILEGAHSSDISRHPITAYVDFEHVIPDLEYLRDLLFDIISAAFKAYQNLRDEYGYTDVRCKEVGQIR